MCGKASEKGRSLDQRIPTKCDTSECNQESSARGEASMSMAVETQKRIAALPSPLFLQMKRPRFQQLPINGKVIDL